MSSITSGHGSRMQRENVIGSPPPRIMHKRCRTGSDAASDRLASLGRLAEERAETIAARLAAETEEGYRERIRLLEGELRRWRAASTELRRQPRSKCATRAEAARAEAEAEHASVELPRGLLRTHAAKRRLQPRLWFVLRAPKLRAARRSDRSKRASPLPQERRGVMESELLTTFKPLTRRERDVRALEAELDGATEAAAGAEARLEEARERADALKEARSATHSDRGSSSSSPAGVRGSSRGLCRPARTSQAASMR